MYVSCQRFIQAFRGHNFASERFSSLSETLAINRKSTCKKSLHSPERLFLYYIIVLRRIVSKFILRQVQICISEQHQDTYHAQPQKRTYHKALYMFYNHRKELCKLCINVGFSMSDFFTFLFCDFCIVRIPCKSILFIKSYISIFTIKDFSVF